MASSAAFPAISAGQQFHIADPASSTKAAEIIAVTAVSGTTWTVTRGAESTTPVAHSAGFTVQQVITAGALTALPYQPNMPWQFQPEHYGALGDGKVAADVSTAATSKVITSATAAFTAADVGKHIMINGANGAAAAPLITTITSYQSATQVTLTAAAGATASNCAAVWATDDTAAINSAITAAKIYALANDFFAEVLFAPPI